MKKTAQKN